MICNPQIGLQIRLLIIYWHSAAYELILYETFLSISSMPSIISSLAGIGSTCIAQIDLAWQSNSTWVKVNNYVLARSLAWPHCDTPGCFRILKMAFKMVYYYSKDYIHMAIYEEAGRCLEGNKRNPQLMKFCDLAHFPRFSFHSDCNIDLWKLSCSR